MAQKQTYSDKMRESLLKQTAEKELSGSGFEVDPRIWSPDFGTYRIRLLPPIGTDFKKNPMSVSETDNFFHTVKFHWMPNSLADLNTTSGRMIFVAKKCVDKDGNERSNPIVDCVAEFYSQSKKTGDEKLKKLAGSIKTKRQFFTNIILYKDDGAFEFKVLCDKSSEGKLIRQLCITAGLPFLRDVEDFWVDKTSLEIDNDQVYCDLLDINEGFDFKLVKTKTGPEPWDISYDTSFAMKKSQRALTSEELELMKERVDLKTFIQTENSFETLETILNNFLDGKKANVTEDEEDEEETLPPKKKKEAKKPEPADEDEDLDDLLNSLDD